MTQTDDMAVIEQEMSNFDHSIPAGFEEALTAEPGKVWGYYNGWDFNGRVWFKDDQFHCEVWVHGSPVEIITEDSLDNIMTSVSNEYGHK